MKREAIELLSAMGPYDSKNWRPSLCENQFDSTIFFGSRLSLAWSTVFINRLSRTGTSHPDANLERVVLTDVLHRPEHAEWDER